MKKRFSLLGISAVLAIAMLLLFIGIAVAALPYTITDFSQCRNGTGGVGPCDWSNGAIGSANSLYYESDGTPQRLYLTDVPTGSTQTIEIVYGTTKASKHAYDYLVSYDHSETYVDQSALCSGFPAGCTSWPASTFPVPLDPMVSAAGVTQAPGVFTMFNGTITGAEYTSLPANYVGDTDTTIVISFTTTTGEVLLAFGGHISSQYDWGIGNSAVSISGKPYHIKIEGRDNQVDTNGIIYLGQLNVVKDANPDNTRIFTFTTSTDATTPIANPFYLQDDGNEVVDPSSVSFGGLEAGTYTVTEQIAPGTSWVLTEVSCTGIQPSTGASITPSYSVDLLNRTLVVNISVDQNVTCLFYNEGGTSAVSLSSMSANGGNNPGLQLMVVLLGLLALAGGVLYRSMSIASDR